MGKIYSRRLFERNCQLQCQANNEPKEATHLTPCLSLATLKVVNMSPKIIKEKVLLTLSRDWCLINAWLMFASCLGPVIMSNISNIISPFANCAIRGCVQRANSGIMVVAVLSTLLTECIRSDHEQLEVELARDFGDFCLLKVPTT